MSVRLFSGGRELYDTVIQEGIIRDRNQGVNY